MAKQANILSFDEAKRASAARRPSVGAPKKPQVRRAGGQRDGKRSDGARNAGRPEGATRNAGRPEGAARRAARPDGALRVIRGQAGVGGQRTNDRGRATESSRSDGARRNGKRSGDKTSCRPRSTRRERPTAEGKSARRKEEETKQQSGRKESRLAKLKRKHMAGKVDRTFTKQYGGPSQASAPADSGPRAAVYKGEMGSTHRRSARMQAEAAPAASSFAKRPASEKRSRAASRLIAATAVTVCIVLSCLFLYPAAQQYYCSVREHARLEAEYVALEQRNAVIQSEVDALATAEGIEDRARDEFGWVKEGYYIGTVYGIESSDDQSSFQANIVPGSIEAPETWYSPFLDPFFGVE